MPICSWTTCITYGVLTKRNAIVILMCIEIMLNAVNLNFVVFSIYHGNVDGQTLEVEFRNERIRGAALDQEGGVDGILIQA